MFLFTDFKIKRKKSTKIARTDMIYYKYTKQILYKNPKRIIPDNILISYTIHRTVALKSKLMNESLTYNTV